MFITFEGIEGSGKTTQIKVLADMLRTKGRDVVSTREPGGTAIGDRIRSVLLDSANSAMSHECELLLYYAARAQHVTEVLRPALARKAVVLCDRYVDATIAYQHGGRGMPLEFLHALDNFVVGAIRPDLTLLFDLPVEDGLARAHGRIAKIAEAGAREDRFENLAYAFHERVRKTYLELAKAEPERFVILNASESIEKLTQAVWAAVNSRLSFH